MKNVRTRFPQRSARNLRVSLWLACLYALNATSVFAETVSESEEVKEVEEVDSRSASVSAISPPAAASQSTPWLNYRGYIVSELGWLTEPRYSGVTRGSAIGEVNFAFNTATSETWSLYSDILGNYYSTSSDSQIVLAQGGFRFRPSEKWVISLGRERNFRAPGMVVNPSDFIHPAQNIPGQRMQRAGVWLTRLSYQTRPLTADFILLPFQQIERSGLPSIVDNYPLGGVARIFSVSSLGDLGLSVGYLANQKWNLGISHSAYLVDHLETHSELGLEIGSAPRVLAGFRWDVGSSSNLTLEGYYNGLGLDSSQFSILKSTLLASLSSSSSSSSSSNAFSGSATASMNVFIRRWYGIIGFTSSDIFHLFNLSVSLIAGLDDASAIGFLRWDWLLSNQSTLGLLLIAMGGSADGQYLARPADGRIGLEWRVNF